MSSSPSTLDFDSERIRAEIAGPVGLAGLPQFRSRIPRKPDNRESHHVVGHRITELDFTWPLCWEEI